MHLDSLAAIATIVHIVLPRCSRTILFHAAVLSFVAPASAQNRLWDRQFGTAGDDMAYAAAPDGSGGSYTGGETSGSLGGPNAGGSDAWLARYDSVGNQTWIRQIGTSVDESVYAAAPDGSGGVYVCGLTDGSLGGSNSGGFDGWLAKYDGLGSQIWIRQIGTSTYDDVFAAAPDGSGGVYVAGSTDGSLAGSNSGGFDGWLASYDGAGNQIWIRQIGTNVDDDALAAACDGSGGVYIGGRTDGSLAGPLAGFTDSWLARYDSVGNQIWARQFGSGFSAHSVLAMAIDGEGGVFATSRSGGLTPYALLSRYNNSGNEIWTRQIGSGLGYFANAAAPDDQGGVYVCGYKSVGNGGGWVERYDHRGYRIWSRLVGWPNGLDLWGAARDGSGGVYSVGNTYPVSSDVWLARYDAAGETYCTAGTTASGCTAQIASSGLPSRTSPTGFLVDVNAAEGNKDGIFFFSTNGRQANPWGNGSSYQCVVPPVKRTGVRKGIGTNGACDGWFQIDFNAWMAANPSKAPGAGLEANMQCWFRDPLNTSGQTTSLSDALELYVNP